MQDTDWASGTQGIGSAEGRVARNSRKSIIEYDVTKIAVFFIAISATYRAASPHITSGTLNRLGPVNSPVTHLSCALACALNRYLRLQLQRYIDLMNNLLGVGPVSPHSVVVPIKRYICTSTIYASISRKMLTDCWYFRLTARSPCKPSTPGPQSHLPPTASALDAGSSTTPGYNPWSVTKSS